MSTFLRYALKNFNNFTLNWLQPASYADSMNSFYGMPWEIFRSDRVLRSSWPVTYVTKSGRVPGYYSLIVLVPEYDLGITILVAGDDDLFDDLRELVTVELIRSVDLLALTQLRDDYGGMYTSASLNSSISLSVSIPSKKNRHEPLIRGLVVTSFVSNATDVLLSNLPSLSPGGARSYSRWHLQLVPTALFYNATAKEGELWRAVIVSDEPRSGVWDDFCITDIDLDVYAGIPINELVFWRHKGSVSEVGLPAFRITLSKNETNFMNNESRGAQVVLEL